MVSKEDKLQGPRFLDGLTMGMSIGEWPGVMTSSGLIESTRLLPQFKINAPWRPMVFRAIAT